MPGSSNPGEDSRLMPGESGKFMAPTSVGVPLRYSSDLIGLFAPAKSP